jgi:hypothetical protein
MKSSFFLLAGMLAFVAVVWSCSQVTPPKDIKNTMVGLQCVTTVKNDSISAATAEAEKALWEVARGNIITTLGGPTGKNAKYIVDGFRIHKDDLIGMLNALCDTTGHTPRDSIFAMLALRNDTITLIFQDRNVQTHKNVYYDFSKPCPPNCPKD